MATDRVDVQRASLLRRAWIEMRESTLVFLDPVAQRLAPVIEGFHLHAWSGKVFLGMVGLGIVGSIGGWAVATLRELLRSGPFHAVPLALTILGIIPGVVLQWWFLKSIARFGPTARRIAVIGCTLGVLGSGMGLLGSRTPATVITSLATFGVMIQFLLYFRSADYRERAEAFRALKEGMEPERR